MKRLLIFTLLILFTTPSDLLAGGTVIRWNHRIGVRAPGDSMVRHPRARRETPHPRSFWDGRERKYSPARPHRESDFHGKRDRPIKYHRRPDRYGRRYPRYWWPASTVVVRKTRPIVVINVPPPPAPEPKKVWVPPVMGTRTQPGFWDYAIRKVWMGDHWLFTQDFLKRTWVPPYQVEYVKQEGYWKIVE
jgi:hypothetical protein